MTPKDSNKLTLKKETLARLTLKSGLKTGLDNIATGPGLGPYRTRNGDVAGCTLAPPNNPAPSPVPVPLPSPDDPFRH